MIRTELINTILQSLRILKRFGYGLQLSLEERNLEQNASFFVRKLSFGHLCLLLVVVATAPACINRTSSSVRESKKVPKDVQVLEYDSAVLPLNTSSDVIFPVSAQNKKLPIGKMPGIVIGVAPTGVKNYPEQIIHDFKDAIKGDFFNRVESNAPLYFISVVFTKDRLSLGGKVTVPTVFGQTSQRILDTIENNDVPDSIKNNKDRFELASFVLFVLDDKNLYHTHLSLPKDDQKKALPLRVISKTGKVSKTYKIPKDTDAIIKRLLAETDLVR